jgi:hypothetical protein
MDENYLVEKCEPTQPIGMETGIESQPRNKSAHLAMETVNLGL